MTDWDLAPPPPKKPTSPDEPRGGPAAGGSAGAGSHSDATPLSAPDTPKAFSGAIIMPGAAKRSEAAGPEVPLVEPPSAEAAGAPAASARRRRAARNVAGWLVAALALLLVGALIGFFVARSQSDQMEADLAQAREQLGLAQRALAQSEERNWNYYRENQALEAALEAQAGDPPSTSTTAFPSSKRQLPDAETGLTSHLGQGRGCSTLRQSQQRQLARLSPGSAGLVDATRALRQHC
mgnify:CR=1 FL=1